MTKREELAREKQDPNDTVCIHAYPFEMTCPYCIKAAEREKEISSLKASIAVKDEALNLAGPAIFIGAQKIEDVEIHERLRVVAQKVEKALSDSAGKEMVEALEKIIEFNDSDYDVEIARKALGGRG